VQRFLPRTAVHSKSYHSSRKNRSPIAANHYPEWAWFANAFWIRGEVLVLSRSRCRPRGLRDRRPSRQNWSVRKTLRALEASLEMDGPCYTPTGSRLPGWWSLFIQAICS